MPYRNVEFESQLMLTINKYDALFTASAAAVQTCVFITVAMSHHPIRTAVVGVGLAGTVFHLPLLAALPGLFVVHTVVERNPQDDGKARKFGLSPKVVRSYEEVLADSEVELVRETIWLFVDAQSLARFSSGCYWYPECYTLSFCEGSA